MPMRMQSLVKNAFPLIAEDIRAARARLGITTSVAAERAQLSPDLYRGLEEGSVVRNVENLRLMVSICQSLGLEEVRFSYFEEVQQQYLKAELTPDGPFVIFCDRLRFDVRELKAEGAFVSPHNVLALVAHTGFYETIASRRPADRQLIELWTAAVYTLYLNRDCDYYVRLIRDDPPDAEVLVVDGAGGRLREIKLEITQRGSHSKDLIEVIGKKLRKRYQKGTILVVLVEQAETIHPNELDAFVHANNPYNQQIVIIGGSGAPGRFKVVPLDEITKPTPGEIAWLEMDVDTKSAGRGYRKYEGVMFKPPGSWFLPRVPVFVKKLDLRR